MEMMVRLPIRWSDALKAEFLKAKDLEALILKQKCTVVLNCLERMTSPMGGNQSERENILGPKKRKNLATFLGMTVI